MITSFFMAIIAIVTRFTILYLSEKYTFFVQLVTWFNVLMYASIVIFVIMSIIAIVKKLKQ